MVLCTPVLWLGTLTLLAAVPRLRVSQGLSPLPALFSRRARPTIAGGDRIPA